MINWQWWRKQAYLILKAPFNQSTGSNKTRRHCAPATWSSTQQLRTTSTRNRQASSPQAPHIGTYTAPKVRRRMINWCSRTSCRSMQATISLYEIRFWSTNCLPWRATSSRRSPGYPTDTRNNDIRARISEAIQLISLVITRIISHQLRNWRK